MLQISPYKVYRTLHTTVMLPCPWFYPSPVPWRFRNPTVPVLTFMLHPTKPIAPSPYGKATVPLNISFRPTEIKTYPCWSSCCAISTRESRSRMLGRPASAAPTGSSLSPETIGIKINITLTTITTITTTTINLGKGYLEVGWRLPGDLLLRSSFFFIQISKKNWMWVKVLTVFQNINKSKEQHQQPAPLRLSWWNRCRSLHHQAGSTTPWWSNRSRRIWEGLILKRR